MPPIRQPLTPYFTPSTFSFRVGTRQAAANDYVFELLSPTFEQEGTLYLSLTDFQRAMGPQLKSSVKNGKAILTLQNQQQEVPLTEQDGISYLAVSSVLENQYGYFVKWLDTHKGKICFIAPEPTRADGFTLAYNFTKTFGFIHKAFYMEEVSQLIPYSVYVPTWYTPANPMKMAVLLHGLGGSDISEKAASVLFRNAEKHGYIICIPNCYARGMHGSLFPMARDFVPDDADPQNPAGLDEEQLKIYPLCEQADMTAVDLVLKSYAIDKKNLFLFGNSMGSDGTFHLGQKYNTMWRAIAPCAGGSDPRFYPVERLKGIPVRLLIGTEDSGYDLVNGLYETLVKLGVDASITRVGGESHSNAWIVAMDEIFEFFDQHASL